MGALKIDCYCSEAQMEQILKLVKKHIDQHAGDETPDIDELVGDVRICIDFENYMDELRISASEILDSDWDVLYEDTAVLTSRLKPLIEAYNTDNMGLATQSAEIRHDRYFSFQL